MSNVKRIAKGVRGSAVASLILSFATPAAATTYQVGPTRTAKRLQDVTGTLRPGDIVELDGNATYAGGVVLDQAGTAAQPITVRGIRVSGARPILSGGTNTIEVQGAYNLVEGLDITGGTSRCFYHHADQVALRDSVIHDCPAQGLLGADNDSGSLLAEYIEVYNCGQGTQNHQIYMSTDPTTHPGAVFRLQYSYIHGGIGGNNVKSRAERNEIYYNWIEGAYYHELELIGPDIGAGVVSEGQFRYDSEVVGNVLRKRGGANFWVVRFGGDLGENSSNGRYRFMSNTVITEAGDSGVFRLHFGLESLEVDDNVFFAIGGSSQQLIRETEATWATGQRLVTGVNNWISATQFTAAPEWTGTLTGTDPGFTNLSANDLHLTETSPLVNHGNATTAGPAGHAFPNPLAVPLYEPPQHSVGAVGFADARASEGVLDIGAYEYSPPGGGGTGGQGAGGQGGTGGSGSGGSGSGGSGSGGSGSGGSGSGGSGSGGLGSGGLGSGGLGSGGLVGAGGLGGGGFGTGGSVGTGGLSSGGSVGTGGLGSGGSGSGGLVGAGGLGSGGLGSGGLVGSGGLGSGGLVGTGGLGSGGLGTGGLSTVGRDASGAVDAGQPSAGHGDAGVSSDGGGPAAGGTSGGGTRGATGGEVTSGNSRGGSPAGGSGPNGTAALDAGQGGAGGGIPMNPSSSSSGCNCSTTGSSSGQAFELLAFLGLVVVTLGRRRKTNSG